MVRSAARALRGMPRTPRLLSRLLARPSVSSLGSAAAGRQRVSRRAAARQNKGRQPCFGPAGGSPASPGPMRAMRLLCTSSVDSRLSGGKPSSLTISLSLKSMQSNWF